MKFLVFLALLLALTQAREERSVIFQTVVYPKTESVSTSGLLTAQKVFDDLGLAGQVTIFNDGTIITSGNRDYILAPLDFNTPRVLYKGYLDQQLLNMFIEFIHQDGFLNLPNHEKTEIKFGLICDTYTNENIEHEVCRPEDITHDIIAQLESQIEQLIISAKDTFKVYVPDSIYVEKMFVDRSTCRRKFYTTNSELQKAGYIAPGFLHYENVRVLWEEANSRTCYIIGDETIAFVITTKHVSVHFDNTLIDPGYDITNNVQPSQPNIESADNLDDGNRHWNPTLVIILIVALVFIFIISAAVKSKKDRQKRAQNVDVVDVQPHHFQTNPMVAMQTVEPAYYVTQTANGPVYYQTNPSPMPQGIVYTVNQ